MSPSVVRADLHTDAQQLIDFLKANVNTRMSPAAFQWQYVNAPGPVIFNIAKDGAAVVCSQSFLPFPMRANGSPMLTAKSENSFLAKEHRGTPLFQDIYAKGVSDCFAANMPVVWGYTPAVKVWRDRLGFRVEEERMWHSIVPIGVPPRPGFKAGPRAWAGRALTAARAAIVRSRTAKLGKAFARADDHEWRDRPLAANDINALVEKLGGASTFHLDMSDRFMAWRVWENPNLDYTGHFLYRGGALAGYALVAVKRGAKSPTAQLSDMAFTSEADGWLLLDRVVRAGTHAGCTWLRFFGNRANAVVRPVFDLLQKLPGARAMPDRGMAFVVKPDEGFTPTEYDTWCMNGLWTEGYSM